MSHDHPKRETMSIEEATCAPIRSRCRRGGGGSGNKGIEGPGIVREGLILPRQLMVEENVFSPVYFQDLLSINRKRSLRLSEGKSHM